MTVENSAIDNQNIYEANVAVERQAGQVPLSVKLAGLSVLGYCLYAMWSVEKLVCG